MVSSISSSSAFAVMGMQRNISPAKMIEQTFDKLDVNADGGIDKSELSSFLDYVSSATGKASDTNDVGSLFDTLDADRDGRLSKQEFSDGAKAFFDALREQLIRGSGSGESGRPDPFSGIDSNQDGKIDQVELSAFLEQRAEATGRSGGPSADEIIARDDTDGDGQISSDEFKAAMSQRPPPPEGTSEGRGSDPLSMIVSLIAQYRATELGDAGDVLGSQLSETA